MLSAADDPHRRASRRLHLWWLGVYSLLVLCASLYPFDFGLAKLEDGERLWQRLLEASRAPTQRDLIVNLLAYVPVGISACFALLPQRSWLARVALAIAFGAALSLGVELLQHLVRVRVPSLVDWTLNVASTAVGALLALLAAPMPAWSLTRRLRRLHVSPALGLLVVVWIASHAAPFMPRFRWSAIRGSLQSIVELEISVGGLAASMAALLVLSAALRTLLRRESFWSAWFAIVALSFAARLLFVGQQLTLDELLALLLCLPIIARLRARNYAIAQTPVFAFVALAWLVQAFAPYEWTGEPQAFSWQPFPELTGALADGGHVDMLRRAFVCIGAVWVAAGSAFGLAGGALVMLAVVTSGELAQRFLLGRIPDTTELLFVAFGALFVYAAERVEAPGRAGFVAAERARRRA